MPSVPLLLCTAQIESSRVLYQGSRGAATLSPACQQLHQVTVHLRGRQAHVAQQLCCLRISDLACSISSHVLSMPSAVDHQMLAD